MKAKILFISCLFSLCTFAQVSSELSDNGKRHYKAAMTLFDMASNIEDYKAVASEFELVISSDPNYADTYFNLGKIYAKLGKEFGEPFFKKAKDAFNQYKQLRPAEANTADDELYAVELIKKQQQVKYRKENGLEDYIDLGLPSGTLWKKKNEQGYYSYDQAIYQFGNKLPSKEQYEELIKSCTWIYKGNGYTAVGPSNDSIFFPAEGDNDATCGGSYGVWLYGQRGWYWTSSASVPDCNYCARCFFIGEPSVFGDDAVNMGWVRKCTGHSVRLVH